MVLIQSHLKLHRKAISLLFAIDRCDRIINNARNYLQKNVNAPWYHLNRDIYVTQYHKYRNIKSRLVISYANVIEKLARPAMENSVKMLQTIVINENGVAEVA